jgi:hypothetical protein
VAASKYHLGIAASHGPLSGGSLQTSSQTGKGRPQRPLASQYIATGEPQAPPQRSHVSPQALPAQGS